MIVELLEKRFRQPVFDGDKDHLYHLSFVFNKLALPVPAINEVQRTYEGGFNLFLNHYGCVVRAYPQKETRFSYYGHIYHHRTLPPLGVVNYPEFVLQVMPGLIPFNAKYHHNEKLLQEEFKNTLGHTMDSGQRNIGFISPKHTQSKDLMLLDSVFSMYKNDRKYSRYIAINSDKILERSAFISDLQQQFYDAWCSEDKAYMSSFWTSCRNAHLSGDRLHSGWLDQDNAVLNAVNRGKGDFVSMSKDYDKRLQQHLKYRAQRP